MLTAGGLTTQVLVTACRATGPTHHLPGWTPPRIANEPATPQLQLAARGARRGGQGGAGGSARPRRSPRCFGNGTSGEAPLLMVGAFSAEMVLPRFNYFLLEVWRAICRHCALVCMMRREGAPYSLARGAAEPPVDLLIDPHWSLPLERLDGVGHRLVFYAWDPGKMGRMFHHAGNMLEMVGPAERTVAQALRRPATAAVVQINKEMRSSGGFVYSWRKALGHLGMSKPAVQGIVQAHIMRFAANWTAHLSATTALHKSG